MKTLPLMLQRMEALVRAQGVAKAVNARLASLGYDEPVAVAGGYCRDLALLRTPKDMDIFIMGGGGMDPRGVGEAVCEVFQHGAKVHQVIPNYDGWAEDLTHVVKLDVDPQDQRFTWLAGCPLPREVDVVFLNRDRMEEYGYVRSPLNDPGDTTFLRAVLDRVDIRLNAIGTTATVMDSAAEWEEDAEAQRLVVQWSRRHAHSRLAKRLAKHQAGKFEGWSIHFEDQDGTLGDTPCL